MKKAKKSKADKSTCKTCDGIETITKVGESKNRVKANVPSVGESESDEEYVKMRTMSIFDLVEDLLKRDILKKSDFTLNTSANMMNFKSMIVENLIGVMIRLGMDVLSLKIKRDTIEVETDEPYCHPLEKGVYLNPIHNSSFYPYVRAMGKESVSDLIKTELSEDKKKLVIRIETHPSYGSGDEQSQG